MSVKCRSIFHCCNNDDSVNDEVCNILYINGLVVF